MEARKSLPKQQPVRFFSFYAGKDKPLYQQFQEHLSLLEHKQRLHLRSVGNISPGADLETAIKKELHESHVILCFLSAAFFHADFYPLVEEAFEQCVGTPKRFVLIKLRHVSIQDSPLENLQALPRNNRPVAAWSNKDEAFTQIAEELRSILEEQGHSFETGFVFTDHHLRYLHWLIEHLSSLPIQPLHRNQPLSGRKREEIYIPPYVEEEEEASKPFGQEKEKTREPPLSFSEATLLHRHLLVLGEPGSGKTLCLQHLALKQAQQTSQMTNADESDIRIPLLLRLADFATYGLSQGKSLSEYILAESSWPGHPVSSFTDSLYAALQAGKCLVLLDGLDEVTGIDTRFTVAQQIELFFSQYQDAPNRVILTSRSFPFEPAHFSKAFARYRLCKLDDTTILTYLQAWYPTTQTAPISLQEGGKALAQEQKTPEKLHELLQKNAALHQLAKNPLFLSILLQLYQADLLLPQRRAALYAQMTHMLFPSERLSTQAFAGTSGEIFWQLSQPFLLHLLSKLGFWLHSSRPGGGIQEHEILKEWKRAWPVLTPLPFLEENPQLEQKMRYLLQTITNETGILIEETPGSYRFAHLSFEEYFAACSLVTEKAQRLLFIRDHLHEEHWQEPILLALSLIGLEDPEEAHLLVESVVLAEGKEAKARSMTPGPFEALLGRDFLFALRCLGESIPVHSVFAGRLIERFYAELASQSGSRRFSDYQHALRERWSMIEISIYAPLLLPHVLKGFKASERGLRLWSVYRLRDMGNAAFQEKEPILQYLRELLNDEDSWIREAALHSLHDLNSPDIRDLLFQALQNNSDRSVQEKAFSYLDERDVHLAPLTELLLQVLKQTAPDPHSYSLYTNVVVMLRRIEDPSFAIVSALISSLPLRAEGSLDYATLETLRVFSYHSSEVVPMLVEAFHDASEHIQYQLYQSLQMFDLSTQRAAEAYVFFLFRQPRLLRNKDLNPLLDSFNELSEQTEKTLQDYLQGGENDQRKAAFTLLCAFDLSNTTFEILCDILLHDADHDIRRHIIQDMEWPTKDLANILLCILPDPDPQIRSRVVETLGKLALKNASVLTALLSTLAHDASEEVRWSVVRCFRGADRLPKRVLSALVQALTDERASIRRDCAQLVGQHGFVEKQTIQALIQSLSDKDILVSQNSSQALILIGQRFPKHKRMLLKYLEHYIQKHQQEPTPYPDPVDLAFHAFWILSNNSIEEKES